MEKREKHFVFVHGACHGAWCWYKVASLLELSGHKVTALDMAASGVHPKQVHEVHTLSDYSEPLMEFMASLQPEEKVILVGHSMGGVSISIAMEKFHEKVSVAVFAAAFMPGPGLTYTAITEEHTQRSSDWHEEVQFTFADGPNNPPTSYLFGPNLLRSRFYKHSPPEDLMLASLLVRHFPFRFHSDVALLEATTAVTKEKYGSVRRVYVVCKKDNAIEEDMQRWMIQENPTDEVMVISDSDHMVMFSKTQELSSCLQEIAEKYS